MRQPIATVRGGANCAFAVATADAGIAMVATGSNFAIEIADVALTSEDLHYLL